MKKMISYVTILVTYIVCVIPSVHACATTTEDDLKTRIHAIAGQNKKFKGDINRALGELSDAHKKVMIHALEIFHPGFESRMDSLVLLGIIAKHQKAETLESFTCTGAQIQTICITGYIHSKNKVKFLEYLDKIEIHGLLDATLQTLQAITAYTMPEDSRNIYHQTLIETFLKPLSLLTTWDLTDTEALLAYIDPHTKDINVFTVFALNGSIKRYLETLVTPQVPKKAAAPFFFHKSY